MVYSLLAGVDRARQGPADVPYIVINGSLPERYYDELAASFPPDAYVAAKNGLDEYRVHRRSARDVLDDPTQPAIWREFFDYHSSREFLDEVLDVWGERINTYHPTLRRTLGKPVSEFIVGRRYPKKAEAEKNARYDLVLDCQYSVNRSVEGENTIRAAHLDSPFKLFAGLFYLRAPEDSATGGDLQFFRLKSGKYPKPKPARIDPSRVELIDTIRYQANTFVLFLNSPLSIHGVTPRPASPVSRRYINLLGEVSRKLPGDFFIAPEPTAPVWYRWARQKLVQHLP